MFNPIEFALVEVGREEGGVDVDTAGEGALVVAGVADWVAVVADAGESM